MGKKLTKSQQAVWDKLNYVPLFPGPHVFDYDLNAMYPAGSSSRTKRMADVVLSIKRQPPKEGEMLELIVHKNR